MTDEDRLANLLLQWEERNEQGEDPSAEELCPDCPHLASELARRIHALKVTSWLSKPDDLGMEPPQEPPIPDSPSRTLAGRYRLDALIAEGGFAQVWRGYDLELQRVVAVKVPKANRLDSAEEFMAEARRVARLKHPGIVPVHDVGREDGTCFIVSEFVEGGSLGERKEITPQQAIRWATEIADALEYAHQNGVVHRDIKPANILIDHHVRALLADFGIAQSANKTGKFAPIGTLRYMSPEQLEGKLVDARSDIYSLGVVLHELLTGKLPYSSDEPTILRREIVAGAKVEGLPGDLRRVCLKALERDPARRYSSASKFAFDLRRLSTNGLPKKWKLFILALTLLAAVGIILSVWPKNDPEKIPKKIGLPPSVNPATFEAALALGNLHFNKKEWGLAEVAFADAIKLNPESAEAYHRRAGSVFNAGKVKESLPDFDVAARLDPKNAEVCKNRGIAYLNLLQFEEALADFRHALELDPDHPEPYRKVMGQTYARRAEEHDQKKKRKDAIADMDEAIRLDPKNAGYFDRRGSCYYNLRQFEEARKDFSEAIRLDPNQSGYFLHRGYAYEALGKKEEAAEDYKKAKSPK